VPIPGLIKFTKKTSYSNDLRDSFLTSRITVVLPTITIDSETDFLTVPDYFIHLDTAVGLPSLRLFASTFHKAAPV
jgi:hypothetical protein